MSGETIGLALGGGSARGLAHIGVLKGLAELGVTIDYVAGTSSGSIIGALFAAGYTAERLSDLAKNTSWRDLSQLLVPKRSLLGNDRMEKLLDELLNRQTFAELHLPFAAVSTDLYTAEKVVLRRGSVARAIRASCSIPGIFPPLEQGGQLLVDGGLVENVPVKTVREMGANRVIAVDLYASAARNMQVEGIVGVLTRSFEIMQRQQSQADFYNADVSIAPRMAGESLIDLHHADDYIRLGYEATMAQSKQLQALRA
jgi:NTE family protein